MIESRVARYEGVPEYGEDDNVNGMKQLYLQKEKVT